MTEYEVLELRHYYRTENTAAFRYWVSLNFAVLVAAYAAGSYLNTLTVIVIFALYAMVTFTNLRVMRSIQTDLRALAEQIGQMIEASDPPSPALNAAANILGGGQSFQIIHLAMRATLIIGTVVFVLHRASFLA